MAALFGRPPRAGGGGVYSNDQPSVDLSFVHPQLAQQWVPRSESEPTDNS